MYVTTMKTIYDNMLPRTQAMEKIIKFLETFDFKKLVEGEDYPIDGDNIFARIQYYDSKPVEECKAEKHERYVDVVYMVEGVEQIGWCPYCPNIEKAGDYDKDNDVTFYKELEPESYVVVEAGTLVVISTDDVHRPCVRYGTEPSRVMKVVIKADAKYLMER